MEAAFQPAGAPAINTTMPAARLLAGVLRAFLFWNTGPLITFRQEDGLFTYHSGVSAAERFVERMVEMGVLVEAGRRGYRVTIRYDAIDACSHFLVQKGINIESIVQAFVVLIVFEGCINILPDGEDAFDPIFYDNDDGNTSFDTRAMLEALVELGYARRTDGKFTWSKNMHRVIVQSWAN